MLDIRIEALLAETKMRPRQHGARLLGIPRGCFGMGRRSAALNVEPAHQVANRSSHRASAGGRIQGGEVKMSHDGIAGRGLRADLDQIVVTRQGARRYRDRMLRAGRNIRPARSGGSRGLRVTGRENEGEKAQFHGESEGASEAPTPARVGTDSNVCAFQSVV